jgi:1-acyl-sn-glycerol-3-phosphate acyltransferase
LHPRRAPSAAIIARSLLYNVLFYLNFAAHAIVALPTFFLPRGALMAMTRSWARTSDWLLRVVCNIGVEMRGLEKLPSGALIVASKHQSTWDTFALVPLFADPTFIIKRELRWLPFFGWFTIKAKMIPVDRGKRSQALAAVTEHARVALAQGRQIVIFPEGTRRPVGAEPNYKYGVAHLYAETGVPCVPIALNSGLYWPRRSLWRYPGTIRLEVLDPIMPGLERQVFLDELRDRLEAATARLVAEGKAEMERRPAATGS